MLNLSLGGHTADNRPLPCSCDVLAAALEADPELVVVASAGNDGHDRPVWPAAMRGVVGVGAVAADGTRWSLSNFGEGVNAWSAGEDCPARSCPGRAGARRGPASWTPGRVRRTPRSEVRFDGWASWTGTSFAAARVSGAIAAELKWDGRSPREVVFDLVTERVDLLRERQAIVGARAAGRRAAQRPGVAGSATFLTGSDGFDADVEHDAGGTLVYAPWSAGTGCWCSCCTDSRKAT